ncbi:MAG: uncharacterized protein QOI57_1251 [Rubrobacteraceae bacterium]|jgi:uncharacterized protein YqjF (DUF2071 family)|nr:uncharacterized protein [Rubrobacteraceae bacterium]
MVSSELKKVLDQTEHRPYPLPEGSWVLRMRWHDLLFMHWPVPESWLRPLIPPSLELDTFDGSAWLGVVPFRMEDVSPRFVPAVPWLSSFPELNLRTYVTHRDKPGIWFFSLDAHNPIAVRLARASFGLPYFDAEMSCKVYGEEVRYESVRTHKGAPPARFVASYRPVGESFDSRPGTLENFLTERYCLYSAGAANRASGSGHVRRGDIHHRLWPLQRAEVEVEKLEMTAQIGVTLPDTELTLHYARRLDVVAWPPRSIDS